ncbi:MAG: helix-turn-helix domain-containing protein [Sphingomonas sp.]
MAVDLERKPEASLGEHCRDRAARHLLDVLSSAYAASIDQAFPASSLMAGRFWKVKLHIEENLRDPTLSPSNIAERLKLSDRYLRTIFAVSDESPSSYILRRRLEECARQLEDPRWRGRSITDIAFSWGLQQRAAFRAHLPRALRHLAARLSPAAARRAGASGHRLAQAARRAGDRPPHDRRGRAHHDRPRAGRSLRGGGGAGGGR